MGQVRVRRLQQVKVLVLLIAGTFLAWVGLLSLKGDVHMFLLPSKLAPRPWYSLPNATHRKGDAVSVPDVTKIKDPDRGNYVTASPTPAPAPAPAPAPNRTTSTTAKEGTGLATLAPGDSTLPYGDVVEEISGAASDLYVEPGPYDASDPPLKKILFWNEAYNNKHFGFGFGREPFLRAKCRVNTCFATGSRGRFPPDQIDALVWHWRSNDKSFPKQRYPHARYVFWMMESASHIFGNLAPYKGLFNWTLTYRLDSDFPNPYGRIYRRRHPLPDDHRNYAEGKTKMAAWFVSNCHTIAGREKLVTKLRQWIDVDIYGRCGKLKCERSEQNKCHKILRQDYKFYLSFENSLCRDYVTEKFFNIMGVDVIPVVYGLGNYSIQAPPHSYIDALSFPNAKALADYLIYLNKNDTAYNEYFRWKRYHFVANYWARVSRAYCDMCERLHTDTTTKTYDIQKWFVSDSHCLTQSSRQINDFIHGA